MRTTARWGVLVLAIMANACATSEPGVYRGGGPDEGGTLGGGRSLFVSVC